MKVLEVNCSTGEEKVRAYTELELDQIEADKAEAALKIKAEIERKAKREAALNKLAALGLEPDDLSALGL